MATYAGMFGSGDWDTPQNRPKNYLEKDYKLFPDSPGVFLMFLQKLPSRTVDDYEFNLYETRLPDMAFTVNGQVAAAATSIVFDAPGSTPALGLKQGDMLKDETSGEVVFVALDPVPPFTTATVIRYWGSTNNGLTIADNSVLRWVRSAYGEGSRSPKAIQRGTSTVTNYTQIFKDSAEVSNRSMNVRSRPHKSWPWAKADAMERHKIKIASALYHGVKDSTTDADGNIVTTTGGLDSLVTTNVWDASGGVSLDDLEDNLEQAFEYGSNLKAGFCGQRAFNIINRVVNRTSMATWSLEKAAERKLTYGFVIRRLYHPSGILDLWVDPLLTRSAKWRKSVYIIDPKNIDYVKLKNGETDFKDNVQENDQEARKGYWITDAGLGVALEETHAIWEGLDAFNG